MKLNIVPARTGITWVKLGIKTFFNQPLALSGLFFMFMAVFALTGLIPVLGLLLGLALVPAASLGLMAATAEATKGKFPMPAVLVSAFRAGQNQAKAMLILGALYAVAFIALTASTAVVDGGSFAKTQLMGARLTTELLQSDDFRAAGFMFMLLYVPFACAFWHAPALVHWHGLSPGKSLFFSIVACWRNKKAMALYALTWMLLMSACFLAVLLVTGALGGKALAEPLMVPTTLLLASMFFVSTYFSFRDSFLPADAAGDNLL